MEINKFTDIRGVVANVDLVEGRMVRIAANAFTAGHNFGSRLDLPGVELPADASEAASAKFVVTWLVPDQSLPMYIPEPSVPWSLRRGFDRTSNLPLENTTIHLTWPGQKHGITIPSGALCLAFGGGVYTFPSGSYVGSLPIQAPGASVSVVSSVGGAGDAGKPYYSTSGVVGYVERFDSSNADLEIRTLVP
jgi:hypothetical protein